MLPLSSRACRARIGRRLGEAKAVAATPGRWWPVSGVCFRAPLVRCYAFEVNRAVTQHLRGHIGRGARLGDHCGDPMAQIVKAGTGLARGPGDSSDTLRERVRLRPSPDTASVLSPPTSRPGSGEDGRTTKIKRKKQVIRTTVQNAPSSHGVPPLGLA
jgi:hypothetical protein